MVYRRHALTIVMTFLALPVSAGLADAAREGGISVIAFGSCAKQDRPQPVWHAIAAQQPDVMLMLGDNIYADTTGMGVMQAKYRKLAHKPGFKLLRQSTPILATWDDHDYGRNNAGRRYPKKAASQQAMLTFFNEPADSPRWDRPGVYRAWRFGDKGQRVQIILLDTRYFRDPLRTKTIDGRTHNLPHRDEQTTLLGEAQWRWLEKQLKKPATVRLIGSSIQVLPKRHRFEKWHNFPHERERLFQLIEQTGASGVVFLSGDRHIMELSRDRDSGPYPMYDFTSSGLNSGSEHFTSPNQYRVGEIQHGDNFGLVRIDWRAEPTTITFEGRAADGRRLMQHTVKLNTLTPVDD
jgi:alkaline phosphatase D